MNRLYHIKVQTSLRIMDLHIGAYTGFHSLMKRLGELAPHRRYLLSIANEIRCITVAGVSPNTCTFH